MRMQERLYFDKIMMQTSMWRKLLIELLESGLQCKGAVMISEMRPNKWGAGTIGKTHLSEQVDGQAVKKAESTAGDIVKMKL